MIRRLAYFSLPSFSSSAFRCSLLCNCATHHHNGSNGVLHHDEDKTGRDSCPTLYYIKCTSDVPAAVVSVHQIMPDQVILCAVMTWTLCKYAAMYRPRRSRLRPCCDWWSHRLQWEACCFASPIPTGRAPGSSSLPPPASRSTSPCQPARTTENGMFDACVLIVQSITGRALPNYWRDMLKAPLQMCFQLIKHAG